MNLRFIRHAVQPDGQLFPEPGGNVLCRSRAHIGPRLGFLFLCECLDTVKQRIRRDAFRRGGTDIGPDLDLLCFRQCLGRQKHRQHISDGTPGDASVGQGVIFPTGAVGRA